MISTKINPEEAGISSAIILNLIDRLEKENIPIHSILMSRRRQIFLEAYYHPIVEHSLQRVFSIAKSFTGVAILLLVTDSQSMFAIT